MQYKIIGQTVPVVEMRLNQGETVFTQSGGFAYSDDAVTMTTDTHGGIMKGIGRMFSGESMFLANYTAQRDNALVAFSSTVPGAIVPIDMNNYPNGIIMQKGAFLCAEHSVSTEVAFSKKLGAGLFGGEGFILQKATGNGQLFLEVDGDVIERDLAAGEVLSLPHYAAGTLMQKAQVHLETAEILASTFVLVILSLIFQKILTKICLSSILYKSV